MAAKLTKKYWSNPGGFCKPVWVRKHGTHKNNLYYLMPGMGRGARKRFWRNMVVGLLVGLLLSFLMWWLFSFINNR